MEPGENPKGTLVTCVHGVTVGFGPRYRGLPDGAGRVAGVLCRFAVAGVRVTEPRCAAMVVCAPADRIVRQAAATARRRSFMRCTPQAAHRVLVRTTRVCDEPYCRQ